MTSPIDNIGSRERRGIDGRELPSYNMGEHISILVPKTKCAFHNSTTSTDRDFISGDMGEIYHVMALCEVDPFYILWHGAGWGEIWMELTEIFSHHKKEIVMSPS